MKRLLVLSLLALAGCRGARAPATQPALCAVPLPPQLAHTTPDSLPADVWLALLFKGYPHGIGSDPVDCTGEPIAWSPLPEGCSEREPEAVEAARRTALGARDLVVRSAGGGYWFGWAPYRTFASGMAEGPLAIARAHDGVLEARALGNLRVYPERARLDVRQLGAEHLLVAEGEHCTQGGGCQRATRLMWLDRQRFRVRPLRSATLRSCLGPAWFPHVERIERPLGAHFARTLERSLSLTYDDARIALTERVIVRDRDLTQPALPARLFREAQAHVTVALEGGEFLSEGQSLWRAIRTEDGATDVTTAAAP